ncbi:MAG: hypothetical protein ACRDO7_10895, partial [Nocardioidaceae bacterium]
MTVTAADLGTQRGAARLERVRELQARVRQIEDTRTVETHDVLPALEPLFPAGGLRVGSAYAVNGSMTLAMALLAGASASGSWCGVVGVPAFGAEAAAAVGIELERTVLVPEPAEHWVAVTAALIDVLSVVVLRPPSRVTDGDVARLLARLRQRGATLIALGDWPRSEMRLSIDDSRWLGLGAGHGHLSARRVTVRADLRTGRHRETGLWLPDPDNRIRPVEEAG